MAAKLFNDVSPALSTLFLSIDGQVKAGSPVFIGTPGSISKRKNNNGSESFVHRYYDGSGRQKETYIGLVADCQNQVEELQERINEAKATVSDLRLLIREGFQFADPKTYSTLASLSLSGLFTAGGTLVGSHAFGVLLNQMGVRATTYATDDVDVARKDYLAFQVPPKESFLDMLKKSGIDFVAVPQLDHNVPSSSFKQIGFSRFHVDLLVPSADQEIRIVAVPELQAHATALPFLSYLLSQTQMSTLIAKEGCCPIRVPVPERFAIHKLVVSQLRTNRDAKSAKDIDQASVLLAVVGDKYPGAIELAIRDLPASARKYLVRATPAALGMLESYSRTREELSEAISEF
jgi:hypothetical protein